MFSLYLFDEKDDWAISNSMTTKFKKEFESNSHWLKFGFHAKNDSTNYGTETKETLLTDYKKVMNAIVAFSSYRNIDTIPRFHYFSAKKESQIYLKENEMPFDGMLAADDVREENAGLNAVERELIQSSNDYYDIKNNLYYLRTEKRLEFLDEENTILLLNMIYSNSKQNNDYILFTHEKFEKKLRKNIEKLCEWFENNEIVFDFPMNNMPSDL